MACASRIRFASWPGPSLPCRRDVGVGVGFHVGQARPGPPRVDVGGGQGQDGVDRGGDGSRPDAAVGGPLAGHPLWPQTARRRTGGSGAAPTRRLRTSRRRSWWRRPAASPGRRRMHPSGCGGGCARFSLPGPRPGKLRSSGATPSPGPCVSTVGTLLTSRYPGSWCRLVGAPLTVADQRRIFTGFPSRAVLRQRLFCARTVPREALPATCRLVGRRAAGISPCFVRGGSRRPPSRSTCAPGATRLRGARRTWGSVRAGGTPRTTAGRRGAVRRPSASAANRPRTPRRGR